MRLFLAPFGEGRMKRGARHTTSARPDGARHQGGGRERSAPLVPSSTVGGRAIFPRVMDHLQTFVTTPTQGRLAIDRGGVHGVH